MIEKILQKNEEVINYLYIISKIIITFLSSYIAILIWLQQNKTNEYLKITLIICLLFFLIELVFKKNRFYNQKISSFIKNDLYQFFFSIFILISLAALLKITSDYSRGWLLLFIFFNLTFLFLNKFLFNFFYKKIIDSNLLRKNILLIGDFINAKELIKKFSNDNKFHFRACIFLDKNTKERYFPIQKIQLDENLSHNIEYYQIAQIWIVASEKINKLNILEKLNTLPIDIRTVYKTDSHKDYHIENIKGYSLYDTSLSPFYGMNYLVKLFMDYILGFLFLMISAPFILFFSFLIFLEDGGPIFFIQKRHGWDGRIINIYKLRSLKNSNETSQVKKNDKRTLSVGRIIRRFSIDELPQFMNVLKGEMSIVGPRPHALEHNKIWSKQLSGFMLRHKCKPGLTGLAQINGYRGNIDNDQKLLKRYEFDMLYIKNWSIWLDIKIVFMTMFKFLFQKAH